MVSHLVFYQLGLIVLVWVFLMLSGLWPSAPAAARPMPPRPLMPRCKHSKKPKPFPGLTRQPCCTACEQAIETPRLQPSPPPLPTMTSTRGRRRHVDTSQHCCPDPDCRYGGWLGLGNITANGHPSGGPWRQLYCGACHGYFLETHGTPLHGKRVAPDRLVWAVGALAEGLGIRAVARVFEVDPSTLTVARKLWRRLDLVQKQWFPNTIQLQNRCPLRQNKFHLPAAYLRTDLTSLILTDPQRFWITGRLSLVYHR